MTKILYTVLSVLSIIYIGFLIVNVVMEAVPEWNPDMGGFEPWFRAIVNFGGVAIIFCFALVNFAGSPLKVVFFILLIVAIVIYVIVMACPEFIYSWFAQITPLLM